MSKRKKDFQYRGRNILRLAFLERLASWQGFLVLTVIIGSFLRFYRIEENIIFHGELGHDFLAIKNFIFKREIPLLGAPTSYPWLSFGPLLYLIIAPILHLANYDPRTGAYFMATVGSLVIVINYFFIEKIFNRKVALLSSYLIAISPAWVDLTRQARFFFLTLIFFYPFLYFLIKSLNRKSQSSKGDRRGINLFWAALFLGIMLNFHWAPLALIPASLTVLYAEGKIKKGNLAKGFIGLVIPNIPFILFVVINKFAVLVKLTASIPYRLMGFMGFYQKNNLSLQAIKKNLDSLYDFFRLSFLAQKGAAPLILVLGTLLFIVISTRSELRKKKKDWAWLTLVSLLVWQSTALFIHKDPPWHYYLAIYPLPILFLGLLLSRLLVKRLGRVLLIILLLIMTVINARFFFSEKWFYPPQTLVSRTGAVPFDLQLLVARTIIKNAGGRSFSLSRVGAFDYFEGNCAQNYQYLLWWLGKEPVEKADLKYTIYENTEKLPTLYKDRIFWIGKLAVLREEK